MRHSARSMQRKAGDVKRKSLVKRLYRMKMSNTKGIDGEKGDALSEALTEYIREKVLNVEQTIPTEKTKVEAKYFV